MIVGVDETCIFYIDPALMVPHKDPHIHRMSHKRFMDHALNLRCEKHLASCIYAIHMFAASDDYACLQNMSEQANAIHKQNPLVAQLDYEALWLVLRLDLTTSKHEKHLLGDILKKMPMSSR